MTEVQAKIIFVRGGNLEIDGGTIDSFAVVGFSGHAGDIELREHTREHFDDESYLRQFLKLVRLAPEIQDSRDEGTHGRYPLADRTADIHLWDTKEE